MKLSGPSSVRNLLPALCVADGAMLCMHGLDVQKLKWWFRGECNRIMMTRLSTQKVRRDNLHKLCYKSLFNQCLQHAVLDHKGKCSREGGILIPAQTGQS